MLWQHLLASVAVCGPVLAQDLLTVLRDNGFMAFADRLEGDPVLDAKHELIVYAPSNEALASDWANRRATAEDVRKAKNGLASINLSAPQPPRPPKTSGNNTRLRLARGDYPGESSAFVTSLENPEWVNLGPGRAQVVVEKTAPDSCPVVFSGLGKSVSVEADDIPFDNGLIRPIDGELTLPESVSATLSALGLAKFQSLAEQAGLLDELDNKAGVTILAPCDDAFADSDEWTGDQIAARVRQHVLVDFPGYTPLLEDGDVYPTLAGGQVKVSILDGEVFLDGVQIIEGDAITINGLVHSLESVLPEQPDQPPEDEQSPEDGQPPVEEQPPVTTSGGTPLKGPVPLGAWACSLVAFAAGTHYFGLV